MTDQFLEDEESVQDSRPRELFNIVQSSAVTYHIASGQRDVTYNGVLYTASPVTRTEVGIDVASGEFQLTISLLLSHPLCQRWLAQGSPPRQVTIQALRMQLRSGLVEQQWFGYVTSYSFDSQGHVGKFALRSRMSQSLDRVVPQVVASNTCPHVLYDRNCRQSATSFTANETIVSTNGRNIVVTAGSSLLSDPLVFPFGDLTHTRTGEVQTIIAQSLTPVGSLSLQAPIPDLMPGDAVVLRAGCDHSIGTCNAKFGNQVNFGGQPYLPNTDIWLPGNSIGIYSTD